MSMKYALVNGQKTEAQKGLRGTARCCDSEMIAVCGEEKMWHWRHESKSACSYWKEEETPWHRAWKDKFNEEWQEAIHKDPTTGEKHSADIKTDKDLVIEFQHSAINPDERRSREAFYKKMVWVVDGTRLKYDYPRFSEGSRDLRGLIKIYFLSHFPDECFPKKWLTSSVPVFFDFQGATPTDPQDTRHTFLWCLFPQRTERGAIVAYFSPKLFIECASTDPDLLFAKHDLAVLERGIREHNFKFIYKKENK
jgi:hypothetical protein